MAEAQESVNKEYQELVDKVRKVKVSECTPQASASHESEDNAHALERPRPDILSYLWASVLSDTAFNGLGMIKMLMDVCRLLEVSWKDIRPLLANQYSRRSCERIDDFFTKHLDKGEHGFPWARVINDGYLRGYSPKENEFVCIVFAAILENERGPGVWQASWVNDNRIYFSTAKTRGKAIYERMKREKKAKSSSSHS